MSERYTRLFTLPQNQYITGSPVLIAAGALLKDNYTGDVIAQLKLRNIGNMMIKAVTVKVFPLDTIGNTLGTPVEYQYLDLAAQRDEEFCQKTPVLLPDSKTRSFRAAVTQVIFTDNILWNGFETEWEQLPSPRKLSINDAELLKQYRIEYGQNCEYETQQVSDLWYCTCGALNRQSEASCHKCGKSFSTMSDVDMNALAEKRDKRIENERQARDEAERLSAKKSTEKKKLAVKIALIAIPIVLVCIVLALLVTLVFIPNANREKEKRTQYESAKEYLEQKNYSKAIELFSELGDYKDSTELLNSISELEKQDKYESAIKLFNEQKFIAANAIFTELGDYKDSNEIVKEYGEYCSNLLKDIDSFISFLENSKYFKSDQLLQSAKKCKLFCGEWRIVDGDLLDYVYTVDDKKTKEIKISCSETGNAQIVPYIMNSELRMDFTNEQSDGYVFKTPTNFDQPFIDIYFSVNKQGELVVESMDSNLKASAVFERVN